MANKPHAALLASPGMGHLIPAIELAKRLHTHHDFLVTVFVVTTDSSTARSLILKSTSNLPSLNIVIFPPVDVSTELGPNPPLEARMNFTMIRSLPLLHSSILSMNPRPIVLIVDIFGTLAFPMAREFRMLTYVLFTCNAWFAAATIYLPVIDKEMEDRHVNHREPLRIPGCKPVPFEDTLEPFLRRGGWMYEGFLKAAQDIISADGILVNTWQDLEPTTVKALMDKDILGGITKGPVYFVGPLVRSIDSKANHKDEVLRWLDDQPMESVIYVSFGSGGTLSAAQITELAWGLELSEQRFVWVVRPPKEEDASGSFFDVVKGREECMDYLPEGFARRNHGVGWVVPMWAPQAEILGHPSVGGFVTHCGWNSTLESVVHGVAMVAWPLYAEQKMNACMLSAELEVAVRMKGPEGAAVPREEIGKVVRRVMREKEGKTMRGRARELMLSAEKSLSQLGASHQSLCRMTRHCLNHQMNGKVC
ncbi:UDP-glycosyltransferase 72E2-like [Neltuma alba]|uniref:UDP-glycosyltransferase 72E2-like n=1 Tax=Neltuma alba TaxID=207710 RepID=UPI0010A456CD|nr:UDP-glycosyltransferase 72E2-like [Prosopis alba]